jgi:PAP2 superfamily
MAERSWPERRHKTASAAAMSRLIEPGNPALTNHLGPPLIPTRYQGGVGLIQAHTMEHAEAAAGWPLFEANWVLLGVVAAALAISFAVTDFSFELLGALVSFGFVALYGGFAWYNAKAPHRRDAQVVYVLGCTGQIIFATALLAPLSYVAAAVNLPLQDANLHAVDLALGLDWRAYVDFVNDRLLLARWLHVGYTMIGWPIFFTPLVLAATGRYLRLQEFVCAFTLALAATVIISGLVPAIGVFYHLGLNVTYFVNIDPGAYLAQLKDLPVVRDGSLRRLELLGLSGLVTFPSFHAASALLYTWAFWPVRWFRPVVVISNGAMLASTPIVGGHYFIDIFAGLAIAVLAIMAAKVLSRQIATRAAAQPAPAAPSAAPVVAS